MTNPSTGSPAGTGWGPSRRPNPDPTERKIRQWEEILGDAGFGRIEAAARIVACANVLADDMNQIARAEGLANQGDYQALAALRHGQHTGRQYTVTDIATALGDTTATTANRVSRLQALGYVDREPHPTDRRSVHIHITPAGTASAERMVLERTRHRDQWLSVLTDDERDTLAALLGRLDPTTTGI